MAPSTESRAALLQAERRQREISERLGEAARVVNSSLQLNQVLVCVLLELEKVLPYDSASVMLLEDSTLSMAAARGFANEEAVMALAIPLDDIPAARQAIHRRRPTLIGDTQHDPLFDASIAGSGSIRSVIAIPLINRDAAIGLLNVDSRTPNRYTDDDAALAFRFAQHAATAIGNARLFQTLKEREEQLRRLNRRLKQQTHNLEENVQKRTHEIERRRQVAESLRDMVTVLNSSRALVEILEHILTAAARLLGAKSGAIFRLQADEETFSAQAVLGLPPDIQARLSFPIERSFLGQALLSRQPVAVSNLPAAAFSTTVELDPQWRKYLAGQYQTLLAVPLLRQGTRAQSDEVYGGVVLYYPKSRQFSDEEMGLAVTFADQAALAIQNAELRHTVERVAVMEERARLARELHDSVTQSLYSLTLFAEAGQRLAAGGDLERVTYYLRRQSETAQQALKEMRLLVYQLRPLALEREGLVGALQQRLDAVEQRSGVDTRLKINGEINLPPDAEAGLYRIAQEALNNALKHAAATEVTVQILAENGAVTLQITDDGQGFDPAAVAGRGGIGLSSMRERAETMAAQFHIRSQPGAGTQISVIVG